MVVKKVIEWHYLQHHCKWHGKKASQHQAGCVPPPAPGWCVIVTVASEQETRSIKHHIEAGRKAQVEKVAVLGGREHLTVYTDKKKTTLAVADENCMSDLFNALPFIAVFQE